MMEISVVIPVFFAEQLIPRLVLELEMELKKITNHYEIILVEDRSPDGSWNEIKKAYALHANIIGIRLSRNFGQHYAISAGLKKASGEWTIVMDCDLQDQPSEISKLVHEAQKGFDVVLARRAIRQDNWLKRSSSKIFYSLLSYLTGIKQDPAIANFGIYHQKVIKAINAMPETIRYFPTMVNWVGFHTTKIDIIHAPRPQGKTSYNFTKLINLALDICLANSDKPLRLVVKTGFLVSIIGFILALFTIIKAFRGEIHVLGYASLLVSIWMLAGLIIFIVGVVGLYVGKSFEGIKGRPAFIVDEVISLEH